MAHCSALSVLLSVLFLSREVAGTDPRIVIILAPPCGGCGTESPSISKALNIPHLDTGNMLRQAAKAGTKTGLVAKRMMDAGELVTDAIVNRIVEDRTQAPDCANGFLLDGFPRNTEQAKFLDRLLARRGEAVSDVLVLNAPVKALEQCVQHRWLADNGNEYTTDYIAFRRPKSLPVGVQPVCDPQDLTHCNMRDDGTGEPLYHRSDDNLQTLHNRLVSYHRDTEPILARYSNVVRNVNGYQTLPQVWQDIQNQLRIGSSMDATPAYEKASILLPALLALVMMALGLGVMMWFQRKKDAGTSGYYLLLH